MLALTVLLAAGSAPRLVGAVAQLPASKQAPQVGEKAPEFTLPDVNEKPVKLSGLLGGDPKPAGVLLIFYRGYW